MPDNETMDLKDQNVTPEEVDRNANDTTLVVPACIIIIGILSICLLLI
jgi:hypothetical protein